MEIKLARFMIGSVLHKLYHVRYVCESESDP